MATILIVDDEQDIRKLIAGLLNDEGHKTIEASNKIDALSFFETGEVMPDAVLLDIWLEGGAREGMDILAALRAKNVSCPIIMMSGHGTLEIAVEAIKNGAYDFLEKPFKTDRLMILLSRALEQANMKRRIHELETAQDEGALIIKSKKMQALMSEIEKVAPTNSRIMLYGEAGTGKSIVARCIHDMSEREGGFIIVNGADFKDDFVKKGENGTVVLEQPEDLNADEQKALIKILQNEHPIRYITTTRADLKDRVNTGRFREDLFYRLNVVPLHLPALRERKDDLPDLIDLLIPKVAHKLDIKEARLSQSDRDWLMSQDWPGNVRELQNTLERLLILGRPQSDLHSNLQPNLQSNGGDLINNTSNIIDLNAGLKEAREAFEKQYLEAQLKEHDYNIAATASAIGMDRAALHRKIKGLGIKV